MSYCTAAEVFATCKPLEAGEGTAPTTVETDAFIVDAGAIIDSYCRERYTVPFDPVPGLINKLAVELAGADVMRTAHAAMGNELGVRTARERRKDAMDILRDIKAGLASVQDGDEASVSAVGAPLATDPTEPFFTSDMDF